MHLLQPYYQVFETDGVFIVEDGAGNQHFKFSDEHEAQDLAERLNRDREIDAAEYRFKAEREL